MHLGPITIRHIAFTWFVLIGAAATFIIGSLTSLMFGKPSVRKAIAVGTVLFALAAASSCGYAAPTVVSESAQATQASDAAPTPDFATVSKLMNDAIAAHRLPGAVVVIGHGGNIVFHQAYGSRKLAGEPGLDGSPAPAEPMTEDTIFDLASLTKSLATATAVMQQYEQGKVQFDDPVQQVFAGLQHGERSTACKGDRSHVAYAHFRRNGRRRPQRSVGTGPSRQNRRHSSCAHHAAGVGSR